MKDGQRQERIFGIVGMLTICLPKSGQQLQTAAPAFCASVPSLIVLALPLLPFIYFMIMSRPPLYALCFVYLAACLPLTPTHHCQFYSPRGVIWAQEKWSFVASRTGFIKLVVLAEWRNHVASFSVCPVLPPSWQLNWNGLVLISRYSPWRTGKHRFLHSLTTYEYNAAEYSEASFLMSSLGGAS